MRKSKRIEEPKPLVCFIIPIRTCSRSSNAEGYSVREWRPGQCVAFTLYANGKEAGFEDPRTAAMFCEARMNVRHGILIGRITMTLDQFDVPTLAHECLHAVLEWASHYRPKKVSRLCAEEMLTYSLQHMLGDAIQGFAQKGHTVIAD